MIIQETRRTQGMLISLWLLQIFVILWVCDTQRHSVVPCSLWWMDAAVTAASPVDWVASTDQFYCGSETVTVHLYICTSLLQRVSFSTMMEDLGISLRCYQGIRKRSRMYCRAKSACVLCQPRCVPKRVEERRDSSMWAWEKSAALWSDWTNPSPQWTILHHQSPFSLYLRLNVVL